MYKYNWKYFKIKSLSLKSIWLSGGILSNALRYESIW